MCNDQIHLHMSRDAVDIIMQKDITWLHKIVSFGQNTQRLCIVETTFKPEGIFLADAADIEHEALIMLMDTAFGYTASQGIRICLRHEWE